MYSIEQKIHHLRRIGIKGKCSEIKKYYEGQPFDISDKLYLKLLQKSMDYCKEYSKLCRIDSVIDEKLRKKLKKKKEKLYNILFPGHGKIIDIGYHISVVIGSVDLGDNIYIGNNVRFAENIIAHIGDYFICSPNVLFGQENGKVGKIEISNNVWICGNATIRRNTKIGNGCLVAAGAILNENICIAPLTAYFGVKKTKIIVKNNRIKTGKCIFTEGEIQRFLKHFEDIGISGCFSEYIKAINNYKYNSLDSVMHRINDYSHILSACNADSVNDLIDCLFPLKGENCSIGKNPFVDSIGSIVLGDNVTIGDNVTLMGNIKIEANCVIGNNVSLYAVGHEKHYTDRFLSKDSNGNLCEINTSGFIVVKEGTKIPDGSIVCPNTIITSTISEKANKRIIFCERQTLYIDK